MRRYHRQGKERRQSMHKDSAKENKSKFRNISHVTNSINLYTASS